MSDFKKITILIPCHNEEKGIGSVIDHIPHRQLKRLGFLTEVIVINNNSTDKTALIAKKRGVKVIVEKSKGKGYAIRTGFNCISDDTQFVVMLDGDNTYKTKEIPRLIEPLASNFCDVVIGSRLSGKMKKNSFKFKNRVANWGYTFLVRHFYGANITDVLSGYFAWKKEALDELIPHLETDGFEIEMEMITKMMRLKHEIYSVPITYDERAGESKLEAVKDGARILRTFFKNYRWKPDQEKSNKYRINYQSPEYEI